MPKYHYFPVIKTRAAELGGYATIDKDILKNILPTFELTKTRLSRCNGIPKHPDIENHILKITELTKNSKFILDITDDEALLNNQLRDLKNPQDGYKNWVSFLKRDSVVKNVIPSLMIDTRFIDDVIKEIDILSSQFKTIAVKIPFFTFKKNYNSSSIFNINNREFNEGIDILITFIESNMKSGSTLLIFLDLGYIPSDDNLSTYILQISESMKKVTTKTRNVALLLSSFPSYVLEVCDNENEGNFQCVENIFLQKFCKDNNLLYADYASIHPVKYPTGGGGWIPRIDFMSSDERDFLYYRYKDDEVLSGYKKAAQMVLSCSKYKPIPGLSSFGDEEIKKAAKQVPSGLSPIFWIKVRMNLFITRKVISLKKAKANYFEL